MKTLLVIGFSALCLLLAAYGAILMVDGYLTLGRMWETPAVRPYEEVLPPMEAGVIPVTGGEALYRARRGEDLKSPLEAGDLKTRSLGKTLYFTFCAQCHGKYHDGNGTVGQSFHPVPTDLRSERVQSMPEGVIFKSISYGIPKPDNRQPPLAATIAVEDRWRVIAYLKSLGPRQ